LRIKRESLLNLFTVAEKKQMLVLLSVMLGVLGLLYIRYSWISAYQSVSDDALRIARTAETSFMMKAIVSLENPSPKNIEMIQYKQIKSSLQNLVSINQTIRFAYIYVQKDGRLYFMADSEPVGSKIYSPPGQEYEAGKVYAEPFEDGKSIITPPNTDRLGTTRVSVLVPMKDVETGKVVAVFAMDYPAKMWGNDALGRTVQASVEVLTLFLVILALFRILIKNEVVEEERRKLILANEEIAKAEFNYRTIADYAYDWETWEDGEGKLKYVSPACKRISGYTVDEFVENEALFTAIVIDEDKVIWLNHRHDVSFEIGVHSEQFRIRNKDGRIVWIERICIPVVDTKGTYLGYRANNRDITKRKKAEEALRESEELYRSILNASPDTIMITDLAGRIQMASPVALTMFGFNVEKEILGHLLTDFFVLNDQDRAAFNIALRSQGALSGPSEYRGLRTDGSSFDLELNGTFIRDAEGQPAKLIFILRDISRRKQANQDLQKWANIFKHAQWGVVASNTEGTKFELMNPAFAQMHGYTVEELNSTAIAEVFAPEVRGELPEVFRTINETGHYIFESLHIRKDGSTFPVFIDATAIKDDSGKVLYRAVNVQDITERKKAEDALKISEEKYRLLTENASDVIWVLNLSRNKFTYISPSVYYLRGFTAEEAMNQPLEEALTPESLVIVKEFSLRNMNEFLLNSDEPKYYIQEIQQRCKNGNIVWVEISAKYRYNSVGEIEIVGVSRNIEERKKSEREVLYLSYHDQLTGLYNRRYYEEELKRLDTKRNLPITLVMADVNGLKLTNDAFGHLAGDELLKKLATIIKQESRADDIIARIGGDEFVLVFPETDSPQAEKIIRRIKFSIEKEKTDRTILSVSFGWATKNVINEDINNIFVQAEDNMYRKKLFESTSMKSKTMKLITKSLYEKNTRAQQHCERVSKLCIDIGTALELSSDVVGELKLLGLLHDIGTIGIHENILNKPGKLDQYEWVEIKRHPEIGYQILRSVNEFAHIAEFVLSHHERLDGKGYPRNLKDSQIPLQTRILSIADAYDAMTNDFPYKAALTKSEAIQELKINSGTQFDAEIVRTFIEKVLCAEETDVIAW
jgi:diguanylate cyclase (GGDEF)-like protein/PAS domain S-box-containing protein